MNSAIQIGPDLAPFLPWTRELAALAGVSQTPEVRELARLMREDRDRHAGRLLYQAAKGVYRLSHAP